MTSPSHLDQRLQHDIDLIRNKVSEMADLVEQALKESRIALLKGKGKLAYSVIFRDRLIDELEKEIDELCLQFLVRQQPVASDLRFVYATIKINQELERIGDYAESIAREAVAMRSLESEEDLSDVKAISDIAIPMMVNAMKAFLTSDSELAAATIRQDNKADKYRNLIYDKLFQSQAGEPLDLALLKPLMTVARRFERVADQATNICEEVLYMCTGQSAKHTGDSVCRILFVDDGHSGFARLTEHLCKALKEEDFAYAVASLSTEAITPPSLDYLHRAGVDTDRAVPTLDQLPNRDVYSVIVALGEEARPALPPAPTHVVGLCWNVIDPHTAQASQRATPATYEDVHRYLDKHVRNLLTAITGEKRVKAKSKQRSK